MKKLVFLKLITFLFCSAHVLSGCVTTPRHGLIFLIPDGYVGWIRLKSNVKGTKPLPLQNGSYMVNIPANGLLKTSTLSEEGWGADSFYYVAKDGKKTHIPTAETGANSMVWGSAGRTNESYMFIGSKQQFEDAGRIRPGKAPGPLEIPTHTPSSNQNVAE